jgi:hypothetical protein
VTSTHEAVLRALPEGGVLWLEASGRSLWPLLRDGDSLRVERVQAQALRLGDVAVVKLPSGVLAAHLVCGLNPLQTMSTAGVRDHGPMEGLARVTAFRRRGETREWSASTRHVLRWWPMVTALARKVRPLRLVIRLLRDQ